MDFLDKQSAIGKLSSIHHLALDMDGTIYNGNKLFEYTVEFFNTLKKLGIGYTYLTNNSSRSVEEYLDKLHNMGLNGNKENVYISSLQTIDYIASQTQKINKVFVLGTQGLKTEFKNAGINVIEDDLNEEPDAVVVGFDTGLNYDRLCKAAYWIKSGKPFIATHPDRICPSDQPTVLVDCGSICTALESATGRAPEHIFGKPDPGMIYGIINHHNLKVNEIAMVGDRLYTDIEMGHRAGILSVLVLSGETTINDLKYCQKKPGIVVENIGELGSLLDKSRVK